MVEVNQDEFQEHNYFYQKPLYVAITRTLNNVYCLYTGELTRYLKNISESLFDDGDIDDGDIGF